MLLQQSIEHVSIVYTCTTYFGNALVQVIYSGVSGQCSHTICICYGVVFCSFIGVLKLKYHVDKQIHTPLLTANK